MSEQVKVLAVGPRAVLAEVADAQTATALALWARGAGLRAADVVPAARSVLFDGVEAGEVERLLETWHGGVGAGEMTGEVTGEVVLPVDYDGADLGFVADRWGCSSEDVVARHTSLTFVATFCGFAPGFSYLAGLPESLSVPRLPSPRDRVPTGSVALADAWCGVYPTASPGGWRILGTTRERLWDPAAPSPALLAPGTRVKFEVA